MLCIVCNNFVVIIFKDKTNVWSVKWRVPDQEVDRQGLRERCAERLSSM